MQKRSRFTNIPVATREVIAENMKERVYSTITLLAVLVTMWQHAQYQSHFGAVAGIIGAVVAVWLATLIAARMSYRAVHGKPIDRKDYVRTFFTSSGLLAPAIAPCIIIILSGLTDLYNLQAALMASIVVSLLSLFVLSFSAGRRIYDNIWRLLLVSLLEMSVGIVVIALKLVVGE